MFFHSSAASIMDALSTLTITDKTYCLYAGTITVFLHVSSHLNRSPVRWVLLLSLFFSIRKFSEGHIVVALAAYGKCAWESYKPTGKQRSGSRFHSRLGEDDFSYLKFFLEQAEIE